MISESLFETIISHKAHHSKSKVWIMESEADIISACLWLG